MPNDRERSRSPCHSPRSHSHSRRHRHHRTRSRSPHHGRHERKQHLKSVNKPSQPSKPLPLNAAPLSKHNLTTHRPLFVLYLDVQKQLDVEDLPEDEVRGRWKSFVKKWNAGDLAEGWYDVKTFEKAKRGTFGVREQDAHETMNTRPSKRRRLSVNAQEVKDVDEDDEDFGPSPPEPVGEVSYIQNPGTKAGPSIPLVTDLRAQDEQAREEADADRETYIKGIRAERKTDRKLQIERLDDLVPRAEPGSRERQLEKKNELAASNRAFAAAQEAGGDVELRDADVMGDEDSLGQLKKMKEVEQRKRTEREIKREEILRSRAVEREERLKEMREKEAKTMEMLKGIARARFGGDRVEGEGG